MDGTLGGGDDDRVPRRGEGDVHHRGDSAADPSRVRCEPTMTSAAAPVLPPLTTAERRPSRVDLAVFAAMLLLSACTEIIEIDPDSEAPADGLHEERVIVIRTDDGEGGDGERHVSRWVTRSEYSTEEMSDERMEEIMIEVRRGLAEADKVMEDMPRIIEEAMAESEAAGGRTVIEMKCDNSSDEIATTRESRDGTRVVMLCQTRVMAKAIEGLREAREEIARDREMNKRTREQILKELDRQIERWEDRDG